MQQSSNARPFWRKKRFMIPAILLVGWLAFKDRPFQLLFPSPSEMVADLQSSNIPLEMVHYQVGSKQMGYVAVRRDSSLPVLIMVHGTPGGSDNFLPFLRQEELGRRFQLIAPDRPGFGMSMPGEAVPSLQEQAALLAPILRTHSDRTVLLAGHSLGGPVIARMAIDYPDLVDGLLLIAPSVDPDLEPAVWWRKIMAAPPFRWMTPTAIRVSNDELIPLEQELREMQPLWKDITAPTIHMHGTNDMLVPVENVEFVQAQFPDTVPLAIDTVADGSHFILWTEVERVAEQIRSLYELSTQ